MKILIKNARVIDPHNKIDAVLDILIENSKISKVAEKIKTQTDQTIDATGKIAMPGLIDMHVHLREPGREDKETVLTGSRAAVKGGFTTVLAMPNTLIPMDSKENIRLLEGIIKNTAVNNVFISGAITKERLGKKLCNIKELKKEGAVAISDDGCSVEDGKLMLEALKKSKKEGVLVIAHCEDKFLSGKGVVNRGFTATRMGLRGIPNESEYKRVKRDIDLAQKVGARIHICHVSCKESVQIIAKAKKKGINVTAETAPHYFSLTEDAVLGYDTNMKMNPPLRSREDLEAIKEGLKNGTLGVIATDHAPHTENEKDIEFDHAEFGVIGLETALSVGITELVDKGILSWSGLAEKMSLNPAKILGIDKGTLTPGADADIVIISPEKEWVVKKENFASKSKNSCFLGKTFKGVVEYTICSGNIVYGNP